jgi:hypothetical protein
LNVASKKREVKVWGTTQEIDVYQKSKTVWIAAGEYMGQRIEAKGRTESRALTSWQEAARSPS